LTQTRLPDPFVTFFRGAMAKIREIWPWCSFIIFTPAEIFIGFGRTPKPRPAVNDNHDIRGGMNIGTKPWPEGFPTD
jgi:hypothetical protein